MKKIFFILLFSIYGFALNAQRIKKWEYSGNEIYYLGEINEKSISTSVYQVQNKAEPTLKAMLIYDRILNARYFIPSEQFHMGFSTVNNCSEQLRFAFFKEYGFNQFTNIASDYYYREINFKKEYLIKLFYWYYTISEANIRIEKTKKDLQILTTPNELDYCYSVLKINNPNRKMCPDIRSYLESTFRNENEIVFFDGLKFFIISHLTPFTNNGRYSLSDLRQMNVKANIRLVVI